MTEHREDSSKTHEHFHVEHSELKGNVRSIKKNLKEIQSLIDSLEPEKRNASFKNAIERFSNVSFKIAEYLDHFKDEVKSYDLVKVINNNLTEITNSLQGYISSSYDGSYIDQYTLYVDSLYSLLPALFLNALDHESKLKKATETVTELETLSSQGKTIIESLENFYQKSLKDFQESTKKLAEENDLNLAEFQNNTIDKVDKSFTRLTEIVETAEGHNKFLSSRVLSGYFEDRAKKERFGAQIWAGITGAAILSIIVVLGLFINHHLTHVEDPANINVSLLSAKVLLTLTLGFIARWTSKRANRHIVEESKYHRLQINLETMKSFISDLDETDQKEIRKAAAIAIFIDSKTNETSVEYDGVGVGDVVKALIPGKEGK